MYGLGQKLWVYFLDKGYFEFESYLSIHHGNLLNKV